MDEQIVEPGEVFNEYAVPSRSNQVDIDLLVEMRCNLSIDRPRRGEQASGIRICRRSAAHPVGRWKLPGAEGVRGKRALKTRVLPQQRVYRCLRQLARSHQYHPLRPAPRPRKCQSRGLSGRYRWQCGESHDWLASTMSLTSAPIASRTALTRATSLDLSLLPTLILTARNPRFT